MAVECGCERLAEVQEELLRVCKAAHVPVKCVMLNKSPHVLKALSALDDVLQRMQSLVTKKSSMLRELKVADRFLSQETP